MPVVFRIGLSVATIASFTMRRLSTPGSDDSESILEMGSISKYPSTDFEITHLALIDLCRSYNICIFEPGSCLRRFRMT